MHSGMRSVQTLPKSICAEKGCPEACLWDWVWQAVKRGQHILGNKNLFRHKVQIYMENTNRFAGYLRCVNFVAAS